MGEALKILVIDDSMDDVELYSRTLQKSGDVKYRIFEADNGETGFEHIEAHNPDCILLDYSLPGRNGIEVLKRIRSKYPHIAVVIMTGQGNENVAVAAIKEGAQDYLSKSSITSDTLQRIIRVAIEYCALQKRIYEQQASLEVFSRALAHDLKEPVNTISSFLDLVIAHETLSERGQGYMKYTKNAATRMLALIDTVYFYTRLDGSRQEIAKTTCDLAQILSDTKENLTSLILERKAIITCDALPKVFANRVQLTQVLQNLLANAIHYCEVDPIIHVHAIEEQGQWKISIVDNGPGINAELQGKLFEPFKRLSRDKGKGLGLGLAICRKILELHHGNIWYEFGSAGGSTFMFTLPKPEQLSQNAAIPTEISTQKSPSLGKEGSLANILLVEDNEADIELTRLMLIEEAKLKCNLLVAGDAFEALTMINAEIENSGSIDLILLDINMPGLDGFEFIERLQTCKILPHIPIVMCTTSNYSKDMERAETLGVRGYLTKPAELGKLKTAIDSIASLELSKDVNGYTLSRAS